MFTDVVSAVNFIGEDRHRSELITFIPQEVGLHMGAITFPFKKSTITEELAACFETLSDYKARQKLPAAERAAAEQAIEDAKNAYLKTLVKDRTPLTRANFDTMRAETTVIFHDPKTLEPTPLRYLGRSSKGFQFTPNDWKIFEVIDTQMNDNFASLFSMDAAREEQKAQAEQ